MIATSFTPVEATLGGMMIGAASAWSLALNGKTPGISGICARALQGKPGDTAWRITFLFGMVLGGMLVRSVAPGVSGYHSGASLSLIVVAGLLVGVGSRISGGCTSGHGVCGIGRASPPSIVATCVFMAVAAAVVFVTRHVAGGVA